MVASEKQQSPARRKIPLRYLPSNRSKITLTKTCLQFLSPYYDNAGRKYSEKHLCKTIHQEIQSSDLQNIM